MGWQVVVLNSVVSPVAWMWLLWEVARVSAPEGSDMGNIQKKIDKRLKQRQDTSPQPTGKGQKYRLPGSRKKKGK